MNDTVVVELLTAQRVKIGVTVTPGGNPSYAYPYMLRRSMMFGNEDLDAFKAKLVTFVRTPRADNRSPARRWSLPTVAAIVLAGCAQVPERPATAAPRAAVPRAVAPEAAQVDARDRAHRQLAVRYRDAGDLAAAASECKSSR